MIRSSHDPENIQRLLRAEALAKCSTTLPRICQRSLAAESPLLSSCQQGQWVSGSAGPSYNVDNVPRLRVETARKGNPPAQLPARISRSSVQITQ